MARSSTNESKPTNEQTTEFPERWTAERLATTMPGSNAKWWRQTMIPGLIQRGVLRKIGQAWIGRRSDIIAALMVGA